MSEPEFTEALADAAMAHAIAVVRLEAARSLLLAVRADVALREAEVTNATEAVAEAECALHAIAVKGLPL